MSLCSINQAISKHDKSSPPSSIMLDKYFPNILQINTHPVESKSFRIAPPTSQWYQRPNKPITATPWGQPAIGEKHLRIVLSHALHLLPNDRCEGKPDPSRSLHTAPQAINLAKDILRKITFSGLRSGSGRFPHNSVVARSPCVRIQLRYSFLLVHNRGTAIY